MKEFLERIKNGTANIDGSPYVLQERSWGLTITFDANAKMNFVLGEPSLHFHRYRTEEYILNEGSMDVYRGPLVENDLEKTVRGLEVIKMLPGDKVILRPNIVHIPINTATNGSVFTEISHGPYEESDIERVYDMNARTPELAEKWSELGYEKGLGMADLLRLVKQKMENKNNMENEKKLSWVQPENQVKVVTKPWGSSVVGGVEGVGELWLNYNPGEQVGDEDKRYVFKKLYIKAGTKTSFQYHVNKLETNHLISGKTEAWYENEKGEIEKSLFEAGDTWTVKCGRKHRIIALTDLVMLEASTPEVDDVIRIADETNRPDGRIESEHNAK